MSRCWLLLVVMSAGGCSWSKRPYADDPLVRGKKAIVGNPIGCEPVERWDRPFPPPPPPSTEAGNAVRLAAGR